MAVRDIIILPDPRLRKISEPVAEVDADVRRLLDDMLETMYDAPGIGLAAVQIGVMQRLVVMDVSPEDQPPCPWFLVNPEITAQSAALCDYEEGCLSVPDSKAMVSRPQTVDIRYLDREGNRRTEHCTGLLARCVQHEIDHLNGVVFIDHLSRLKRTRIARKCEKAARGMMARRRNVR